MNFNNQIYLQNMGNMLIFEWVIEMKKIKLMILAFVIFLISPSIYSAEINHFVSNVDNDVDVSKVYNSSVALAGDSVSIKGTVNGIAFGAGNKVVFDGTADYGVLAGNNIDIRANVLKDTFVAGNVITINDEAIFNRDVIMAGTDISLSGDFERNVSLYAGTLTLKNVHIKGNLKFYGQNITISEGVVIDGVLSYPEDSNYNGNDTAIIGSIEKTPAIQTENEENYFVTLSSKLWSLLGTILVFAFISIFFPKVFNRIDEKYKEITASEGVEVFTKGLVILILIPIISAMLFFTMFGIPLAIILLLVYGISIYLSSIFTGYLIGYKIWQKVFAKEGHILFYGLIGLTLLFILELIPGVRFIIMMIAVLVGLGLVFDTIKNRY